MLFDICQEKPIHHTFAIIHIHARMVSQGFLHIRECTFNHIVGIWHTLDIFVGKEKR